MKRLTPLARHAARYHLTARAREHYEPGPGRPMNLWRRIVRALLRAIT